MKLSVEAKVAAVVAAGFLAVSVGVVAQGNNTPQTARPNERNAVTESVGQQYVNQGLDVYTVQSDE
jgi:hypothetical protein